MPKIQGHAIQVHGHRGARAVMPENTIAGFEYAISVGVDAIELDVVVSSDDVVVVSHDPWLSDKQVISRLYAEETGLPRLDQVFALAERGDFLFNVEAKVSELSPEPEEFAPLVLDYIRRANIAKRVIFQSFNFRILHVMEELAPDITRAALWEGAERSFVDIAKEARTPIVAPEHHLVTADRVHEAHQAGFKVIPWTANTQEDWDRLIETQVDGIITDDPASLIDYMNAVIASF